MASHQQILNRRTLLQFTAVLGAGFAAGSVARGDGKLARIAGAASPAADATATREAEIGELNDLRTQVAEHPVCTPAPTETPISATATPTQVPPLETGVAVPYLDLWTFTLLGIGPTPGSPEVSPVGQFMQVNLSVSHSDSSTQLLPFLDFVLVDSSGQFSVINQGVNQQLLGNSWLLGVEPGVEESRAWIFDVASDAGDSFILESKTDPTFRVALEVEQFG